MLERFGDHIGKRLDPDRSVSVDYIFGKDNRWRWVAYYALGEHDRGRVACVCPIRGYDSFELAVEAATMLLNVRDE